MSSVLNFHPVIAFSGGRTSALMLRRLIDSNPDLREKWTVLFCNTGKEFDATLDFVHEVETRWQVPVVWLEYTRVAASSLPADVYPSSRSRKTISEQAQRGETTHWFRVVNYQTASRDGRPFNELLEWMNVLPNRVTRACSVQMKVRTMMRYLFSQGVYAWSDHIGIRADEAHRVLDIMANAPKYTKPAFPLCDAGISEADVDAYWAASEFDLQLRKHEGNCDLCFLKKWWKRSRIARANPERLKWWESWEQRFAAKPGVTGDGRFFRPGQPYSAVRIDAETPEFAFADDSQGDDISCGCTDGAFRFGEMEEVAR